MKESIRYIKLTGECTIRVHQGKTELRHEANQKAADMLKKETSKTLHLVLDELSFTMKNKFARSDA